MELFNPGNFTACAQDLIPGMIYDMSVDPEKDMRVDTYRAQARHDIAKSDPVIVLPAPPCTVFSSMQNINQKHHEASVSSNSCCSLCGIAVEWLRHRVNIFKLAVPWSQVQGSKLRKEEI